MPPKNATLYDSDFYAWTNEQAALLRAGRLSEADIENIAEEIESMGKSEKRELVSRLAVLLAHLLKWRYQSQLRGRSWRQTIETQRRRIARHLAENPSLKTRLDEAMVSAYDDALDEAERDTHLPRSMFPSSCPYTHNEAIDPDFWPN